MSDNGRILALRERQLSIIEKLSLLNDQGLDQVGKGRLPANFKVNKNLNFQIPLIQDFMCITTGREGL